MPIILDGGYQELHTEAYPSPFGESIPAFEYRGLDFGGHHGAIQVENFTPGGPEIRFSDTDIDQRDGVLVGQDYLGPRTWGWSLFTDVESAAEAFKLDGQFARRWLDPEVRKQARRVEPLRYFMAGRWRRVYGRPRRYSGASGDLLTRHGRGTMEADFLVVDHLHYDDVEQSIQVGMVPATVGGFTFPLTFPIVTASRTATGRQITTGGDAPTWPKITIEGPISDPSITIGPWTLRLVGNLAYDQTAVLDTAPWAMSLTDGNGRTSTLRLHASARFSGLSIEPGHHEVVLTGTDLTGTARATIAWRDAYYSL